METAYWPYALAQAAWVKARREETRKHFMNVKLKAAQISKPGEALELVERDVPEPGPKQVRSKVEACGICHRDMPLEGGWWPGSLYPRVAGHETAIPLRFYTRDLT